MDVANENDATQAEIVVINQELEDIERQITELETRRFELEEYRDSLQLSLSSNQPSTSSKKNNLGSYKGKDYGVEDFKWSEELKRLAKIHWNISKWRDKQLHAMNAALDGRDVFVLMPTGGGKSLCYQLPALLTPGITLVVSPLLSLIRDQAFHLEEASIGVGMLTSYTTKEETKRIMDAMLGPKLVKGGSKKNVKGISDVDSSQDSNDSLKLVYVTPEKLSKSKRFMSHLEKVYTGGRLGRVVIDECHCCSDLGHDFRPDYKKLGILRVLFPNTPIMALTATATQSVMQSVLSILNLAPIDQPGGTLLFDSPLFRPNLTYKVLTRPGANQDTFNFLADYIQNKHSRSSGIVYCLSKKDTHTFADGIAQASNGRIRTSAYHADIEDYDKELIHEQWRDGRIQVVCATIAFGLGINHPNVRFVIHVCIAKSLEGYYQESGRAGRDGLPAECILLYKEQDASRLSTLCISEPEGITNVYGMMKYAQDIKTCRHQLFDRHFSKHIDTRLPPCGFCDNCVLGGSDVFQEDLKKDVQSLCLLLRKLETVKERVTLNKLVEAWRGVGPLRTIAKAVRDEHQTDVVTKRTDKDDYDRIINYLIINGYLKEDFHFTMYSTLSYIINGPKSNPFTSKRPISALPPVIIHFSREPSRSAIVTKSRTSETKNQKKKKTDADDEIPDEGDHQSELFNDEIYLLDNNPEEELSQKQTKRNWEIEEETSSTSTSAKNRKLYITLSDDDDFL